jgi:hypothetical protein
MKSEIIRKGKASKPTEFGNHERNSKWAAAFGATLVLVLALVNQGASKQDVTLLPASKAGAGYGFFFLPRLKRPSCRRLQKRTHTVSTPFCGQRGARLTMAFALPPVTRLTR